MMRKIIFRRRREGVTNYAKRVAMVKSGLYRLVVRKTNRRIIGQVVKYDNKGDIVLASADSNTLKKLGWPSRSNRATAYLTGMLLAKRFTDRSKELILDIGLNSNTKGSIPFVFAKGCVDAGMKVRGNFEVSEDTYNMSNVQKYAEQLKSNPEKYKRVFGEYIKSNIAPENFTALFNQFREKLKSSSLDAINAKAK